MIDGFFKVLNVERAEQRPAALLLGLGFTMGIFVAVMEVIPFTLFLTEFSEKQIPLSFIASGIIGISISYLFSFLQRRVSFQTVVAILLGLFFLLIVTSVIGLAGPYRRQFIFLIYSFSDPIAVVMLLMFWGAFNRVFNLRQAKRIIGGIDTGQLIATILAFFSIPFIASLLPRSEDLLYLAFVMLMGFGFFFYLMGKSYTLKVSANEAGVEEKDSVPFTHFFTRRFFLLMSFFVIISAISLQFLDYTFLAVADRQFLSEDSLTQFKSYFEMVIVIFSFLFQTFTTDKIISIYGLRVALLVNPVLLLAFTALAIVVGMFTGINTGSENFVYFFVAISLIRLFIQSLRDALDGPSFKLYFLPIESNIRADVQSKIEGVITVISGIISGGIILLLDRLPNFNVLYILIFMLPMVGIWYFITQRMYGSYKSTLIDTLNRNKNKKVKNEEKTFQKKLAVQIQKHHPEKALQMMHQKGAVSPDQFEEIISQLETDSHNQTTRDIDPNYWKKILQQFNLPQTRAEREVKTVRDLALAQVKQINKGDKIDISSAKLYILAKSKHTEDRLFALKIIHNMISDENAFIIQELLRDLKPDVRFEAIRVAGQLNRKDLWPALVELLGQPRYAHEAQNALIRGGQPMIMFLASYFSRTGMSEEIFIRIVLIIKTIGGNLAKAALWQQLDNPSQRIHKLVVETLYEMDFHTSDDQFLKFTTYLRREVSKAIWNMAALTELGEEDYFDPLKAGIQEELDESYELIFMMLSILYDKESIHLVRDNLEIGTNEGVTFAIELMDQFLSNDLKLYLYPFFDDISPEEKIKALHSFFPRNNHTPEELMLSILSRDIHFTGRYTKASALNAWYFSGQEHVPEEIIAQLFNSDPLLYEMAARCILKTSRPLFRQVEKRLPDHTRHRLQHLMNDQEDGNLIQYEILRYIEQTSFFCGSRKSALTELTSIINPQHLRTNKSLDLHDYIILVKSGQLVDQHGKIYKEGDLILSLGKSYKVSAFEDSLVLSMDKVTLYHLLGLSKELSETFMEIVDHELILDEKR